MAATGAHSQRRGPTPGARARLDAADRLLREPEAVEAAVWPRACTWLIRIAVEHGVDDYWSGTAPAVARTNRRAQFVVLRHREPELGQRAEELWSRLSRAAHHHAYELAPTAAELRAWHGEAEAVIKGLAHGR
ncbi:hypothetical protein WIS52_29615 [Pseudonocardia nematodicida]|uniref:SAV-6107-like HEPN domain-containing protein n=1 Tax=Pseudonocardia nematodicida TaxID=1206997 RepID=A0ABV1KM42_9PSEU